MRIIRVKQLRNTQMNGYKKSGKNVKALNSKAEQNSTNDVEKMEE